MKSFPKPVRKEKQRRPLRARRRSRSETAARASRRAAKASLALPPPVSPKGTKHRRRAREFGYMHFCKVRGCELALDADMRQALNIPHVCSGPIEFAHLSDLKRYDVGDVGAGLCRDAAHQGIDGKIGGKATWYVELGRFGQKTVRLRLSNRPRAAWDALTPEVRAEWDARARAALGLPAASAA